MSRLVFLSLTGVIRGDTGWGSPVISAPMRYRTGIYDRIESDIAAPSSSEHSLFSPPNHFFRRYIDTIKVRQKTCVEI
ncbi:MAG: hypothetical protein OEZ36_06835 [Spirochaetota bacterium]|nr:hypothetical protein [Spirochaetota bacterium]